MTNKIVILSRAQRSRRTCFLLAAAMLFTFTAKPQQINGIKLPKKVHVSFIENTQTIPASKPATLTLHFAVEPGFHINSHTPANETLIPTRLAVEDDAAYNVKIVNFPQGTPYSFAFAPNEKLDVYTGDFVLTVHLTAKPGTHALKAALAYQACDSASCYPPKTLPVVLNFTAK